MRPSKRFLVSQVLESRQMLAGDCGDLLPRMFENGMLETPSAVSQSAETLAAVSLRAETANAQGLGVAGPIVRTLNAPDGAINDAMDLSFLPPYTFHNTDLVQEFGDRVFVVSQSMYGNDSPGTLFVFKREVDGSLSPLKTSPVEFHVDKMFVFEQQVVLIGSDPFMYYPLLMAEDSANTVAGVNPDGNVDGSQPPDLILPPWDFNAEVHVMSISLESGDSVYSETFEGRLSEVIRNDQQLILTFVRDEAVIAIYPPPPQSSEVRVFEIAGAAFSMVAKGSIAQGQVEIADGRIFVAETVYRESPSSIPVDSNANVDPNSVDPNSVDSNSVDSNDIDPNDVDREQLDDFMLRVQPFSIVHQYAIREGEVQETGVVELGEGYLQDLHMRSDGELGVARRSMYKESGENVSSIDMIDTSGSDISLLSSVDSGGYSGSFVAEVSDDLVWMDYDSPLSLLVFDTNPLIDIAPENRITRIEIPEGLNLNLEAITVFDDQIVMLGHQVGENPIDGEPGTVTPNADGTIGDAPVDFILPYPELNSVLVTFSLDTNTLTSVTELDLNVRFGGAYQLFEIDPSRNRLGFVTSNYTDKGLFQQRIQFGHIDGDGNYVNDGVIAHEGHFIELDATSDRLVLRENFRLVEYAWEGESKPTLVTRLTDPNLLPIVANDDRFSFHDSQEDYLLDVLANDRIGRRDQADVKIAELVGAPEGTTIEGRWISLPQEAFENQDSIRFEYVVTDGITRSKAVVAVSLKTISQETVDRMVLAVREMAAKDFDVPLDDVRVRTVEKLYDSLPVHLRPELVEENMPLDLAPGILVMLDLPQVSALYAASLEGRIVQIFVTETEKRSLVDLGLRAVNDDGVIVSEVPEGTEFWLEFTSDDLRDDGEGVYAAFFDLELPEGIRLDGPIEYGDGFSNIAGGSFTEHEVLDLGAIGNRVESPGNELQSILRIRATAVKSGDYLINARPADALGTGILLRGETTPLVASQIRFEPLQLSIVGESVDPLSELDVDRSGDVTANDALRIVNFLSINGSTRLRFETDAAGNVTTLSADEMSRMLPYDANQDGTITALDALIVINHLHLHRKVATGFVDDAKEKSDNSSISVPQADDAAKLF